MIQIRSRRPRVGAFDVCLRRWGLARGAACARATILVLALVAPAVSARAAPVTVGGTMPALTLEDQHGRRHEVAEGTRLVLFTRDMDGGGLVKSLLASNGAAQLEARAAVYVADVSAMPALVRRLFALPKMRERPYPILLDATGEPTRDLPSIPGRVTVLRLDRLRVTAIETPGTEAEVRAAFDAPTSSPSTQP